MFEQILQILTLVSTVAGTVIAQIYGYKAVNKNFDGKLKQTVDAIYTALSNKVDVQVYALRMKDLHDKNNALERNQASLTAEVKLLKEMLLNKD